MKPRWSSRSLGSRFQHRVFYKLIRMWGWRAAYVLLFFVVLWYTFWPSIHARSRAYRHRIFPNVRGIAELPHIWRLQWNFGKTLVDRAVAGITKDFSLDTNVLSQLLALTGEGKGLILISAHTGCWDMGPLVLAEHTGLTISVLAHKDAYDVDKHAFEHTGKEAPYTIIGPEDGPCVPVALMKRLHQGELVCMMGDRSLNDQEHSVGASFLGDIAPFPYTPYRLSSATGAPVAVFFALRTGICRGRLLLADVIRVPGGLGNAPENYQPYVQRFAATLEAFTRENPYQFFNFFDLWER